MAGNSTENGERRIRQRGMFIIYDRDIRKSL